MESDSSHVLTGRVVVHGSLKPLPDIQVVVTVASATDGEAPLRLGSALTGADGSFLLEYDPSTLGGDQALALSISVHAPTGLADERGTYKDEDGPLAHLPAPIRNPGPREELIISVPSERVERAFRRSAEGSQGDSRAAVVPQELIDRSHKAIGANFARRQSNRRKIGRKAQRVARMVFEPKEKEARPLFLPPDRDATEATHDLIEGELERLADISGQWAGKWTAVDSIIDFADDSATNESIAASLPDTVTHPGLAGAKAEVYLKNTGGETCRKAHAIQNLAQALEAPEGSEAASTDGEGTEEPLEADATTDDQTADSTVSSAAESEVPSSRWAAQIEARIEEILQSGLQTPEMDTRPGPDEISESLDRSLSSGPADRTAYYDFHHLKMAFRSTWTRLVDTKLAKELENLYAGMIQLDRDFGFVNEDDETETETDTREITELAAFLAAIGDRVGDLGDITPVPEFISSWAPSIAEVWHYLSPTVRSYAHTLHWLDTKFRTHFVVQGSEMDENTLLWSLYHPDAEKIVIAFGPQGSSQGFAVPPHAVEFLSDIRFGDASDASWIDAEIVTVAGIGAGAKGHALAARWAPPSIGRLTDLLTDIQRKQELPYRFDVFSPGSYNFGIVVTYRQAWKPLGYQAGELVAAVPLAPGEVRKYSKVRKIVTKRSQKEIEKALSSRKYESRETRRLDAEIVRKAQMSTNFSMSSEGTIDIPIGGGTLGGGFSQAFDANSAQESATKKNSFREAVRSAASEYKEEHIVEVATDEESSSEFTESGEIKNPNNEIPVTYLFYELQRRFQVHEELHRVTPVILVALNVPTPDEINEAWLLEHEWILRRVILDDRMMAAFDELKRVFPGGELAVEILRAQWETQRRLVEELEQDLGAHVVTRSTARARLRSSAEAVAREESREGMIDGLFESLFGDNASEADAEARSEVAEQLLSWAESDLDLAEGKIRDAVGGLQAVTKDYVAAVQERLNRRVTIDQLLLHIKQNILYYMQAIWAHEPPDQLFFRLYDLQVRPPGIGGECRVVKDSIRTEPEFDSSGTFSQRRYVRVRCPSPFPGPPVDLVEIADLSNLLGFKGNYAMFPLRVQNGITEFLMQDYLHDYHGVYDPDPEASRPSLEELEEVVRCIDASEVLRPDTGGAEVNREAIREKLLETAKTLRTQSEEITVPTGELFIEALPGSHTVLENFKLRHRIEDVRKARAEADTAHVETLRQAARLFFGQLGDPDTERTVVVSPTDPSISLSVETDSEEPQPDTDDNS